MEKKNELVRKTTFANDVNIAVWKKKCSKWEVKGYERLLRKKLTKDSISERERGGPGKKKNQIPLGGKGRRSINICESKCLPTWMQFAKTELCMKNSTHFLPLGQCLTS